MGCFGNFQKLQKRKILTFSPILAWISISSMWNSGMKCSAVSWVKDSTHTVNLNLVTDFRIFLQQNEFGSLQSDMCGIWLTYNVLGWAYEIVKKLRPFKTICIYKSGQKLQIIFFTSFLCNCKKELMSGPEIDKSLDSEAGILVRIWAECNIVFWSKIPKTLCMKYWHNTTFSVNINNSIFLIL